VERNEPLRVAVLSNYALVRAGLTTLVHSGGQRAIVVDIASSDGHLAAVDVAIYDLAGLADEATRADLEHVVGAAAVVGLLRDGREDLAAGARALGVRVLVPENVASADLLDALEAAAGRRRDAGRNVRLGSRGVLTDRERMVLTLIADGLTNGEIAAQLYLSINSVKTYVRTAYRKIGVDTRSQAVLWGVQHGLVDPGDGATPLHEEQA
jgi:DNA-binding NarL/FixJ family response regulator